MKIFIIGMHRAGTSMIAGILRACGLDLGNVYLEGDDNNPKGYFEDRQFIQINQNILFQNKGDWNIPPEHIWFYPDLKEEMLEFLNQWDSEKIVCLKDPRTCLTLPLWHKIISPESIRAIISIRPISAIAKSLKKRDGISIQDGKKLTKFYIQSAFMSLYRLNIPFISASYNNFFRDWRLELGPVLKFLDLNFPLDIKPIEDFVDINLWHQERVIW